MEKTFTLTEEEIELVRMGLACRVCIIETGTHTLRAHDVEQMLAGMNADERALHARHGDGEVKALSVEQMKLILASDNLARKLTGRPL